MQASARGRVQFYDYHPPAADFRADVLNGLTTFPKAIPPKYFYDARGSQLFDAICELDEYYLTRAELLILQTYRHEIATAMGKGCLLVEPGSGNSTKVRALLDVLRPYAYVPLDISREHLITAAHSIAEDYPWLHIRAACTDFTRPLDLPYPPGSAHRVAFFPGSSLGNFEPGDAPEFLANIGRALGPGSGLLIGIDLKKDPALLHAAYNDSRGITAQFNLNLLRRINRDLDGTFVLSNFYHQAFYDSVRGRMEMHLVSRAPQEVRVSGERISFRAGESIHTENSYKYSIAEFQQVVRDAGYAPQRYWIDPRALFSVHYCTYQGSGGEVPTVSH